MLLSIQTGMFLEPLSQIVAKDLVNTEKKDVSVEKVRPFRKTDSRTKRDSVNSHGETWSQFLVRELAQPTMTLTIGDNFSMRLQIWLIVPESVRRTRVSVC